LLDFETLQKQKFSPDWRADRSSRNDVTVKKLLADCFKTISGLPEDWTVSGPCHLYTTGTAFTLSQTRQEL